MPIILLPEADDPTVQAVMQDPKLRELEAELGVTVQCGQDGAPVSLSQAASWINDGTVDVVVTGAIHSSADVIRTAIKEINRASPDESNHRKLIHSFFVMEKEGHEPLVYADCAVNAKPTPEQLAQIAYETAVSFQQLFPDRRPVVAFLSLSTFGSANTDDVLAVRRATELFHEQWPDVAAYGEIQADAALNKTIFDKKAAKAGVTLVDEQMPNILIFPDGQSGNIGYKLTEQLGGYVAIGPMLNGIIKDWHDLSRGVTSPALLRSIYYATVLYRARQAA